MDALARRDAAHTAYWKSSNDKALSKAFEDAQAEWDAAHQAWLTKMVRCLLEPQAAAPAPAVAESASDAPACDFSMLATRDQLIEAFGRFTNMDASWFNNLKDTPCFTERPQSGRTRRARTYCRAVVLSF